MEGYEFAVCKLKNDYLPRLEPQSFACSKTLRWVFNLLKKTAVGIIADRLYWTTPPSVSCHHGTIREQNRA